MYNFFGSTAFILVVSLSEVVWKIQISNLRNSNIVFLDKMISNQKIVNYNVSYLFGSTTFILVVSPSEVIYKIWISNFKNSNVIFIDKMISNQKVVNYKVS